MEQGDDSQQSLGSDHLRQHPEESALADLVTFVRSRKASRGAFATQEISPAVSIVRRLFNNPDAVP